MSWSEKKTDSWGNEYTQHYDDSGNKVGWSEIKTDAWGSSYEQHYDQDGDKSGWSESKNDAWSNSYDQHCDQEGSKAGWSESKTDAWGGSYEQHYDQDSTKRGWSESRTDAWGNPYEQAYNQDGLKSGTQLHSGSSTGSRSRGGRRSGSGSGGGAVGGGGGEGLSSLFYGFMMIAFVVSLFNFNLGVSMVATPIIAVLESVLGPIQEAPVRPARNSDRAITQQEIDDPAALVAAVPSGNMNSGEYALTHSFVRYERPRAFLAPGQPGIGWQVPLHAEPTTLSARLAKLSYNERVTSQGHVQGPDGRTWEVISREDGTLGFVLQRELRPTGDQVQRGSTGYVSSPATPPRPSAAVPVAAPTSYEEAVARDRARPYADNLDEPFCSGDYEVRVERQRAILCSDPEALRLQRRLVEVLNQRVALQGEDKRDLIFGQMPSNTAHLGMCGSFPPYNPRRCIISSLRDYISFNINRIAERNGLR